MRERGSEEEGEIVMMKMERKEGEIVMMKMERKEEEDGEE